jgi:hypothetical protein
MAVSAEFKDAVAAAQSAILERVPDDAVRYMLTGWGKVSEVVPIWLAEAASPAQLAETGCPHCAYLGLWAPSWPGYPSSPHGMVWLFERSIRGMRKSMPADTAQLVYLQPSLLGIKAAHGPLVGNVADVLVHELQHALQRDHVLDAMERARAEGYATGGPPASRGCGSCPSSSR